MPAMNDIRSASTRLHAALNGAAAGDAAPMREVRAKGSAVSEQHPVGGRTPRKIDGGNHRFKPSSNEL